MNKVQTSNFVVRSALILLLAGTWNAPAAAAEIQFATLDAQTTDIGPIFQRWYDDEMQRQGGPGKQSHGWWPWGLRAFDFDNDGDLDLLASHHGVPGSILLKSLYKETGKFQFTDAMRELGVDGRDLPGADDRPWIWDFDGDRWLDIGGFSDESRPASVWNQGGKKFVVTRGPLFPGLSHPREVIDLDGDGYLDVDGGKHGQFFYLPQDRTFRHDKTPRFKTPDNLPAGLLAAIERQSSASNNRFFRLDFLTHDYVGYDTRGYAARPIDLNGDGTGDLVLHGSGGYGAAYLGRYLIRDEHGTINDKTAELGLPVAGAPILIDDLTGDGRTDLLIAGKETGGVYIQNEDGKFRRLENPLTDFLSRPDPYLLRAWRVDFDNDGDADLVISSPRLGREAVFENRGAGDFAKVLDARGWDSNPIAIADFDDDGRMDMVIGGGPGNDHKLQITLYLNQTTAVGNFAKILPRMPAPNPYAVGSVVEIFSAGQLDESKARPLFVEKAHTDGKPIHAGLGQATTYDLRVTFPGGKTLELRGANANRIVIADSPP